MFEKGRGKCVKAFLRLCLHNKQKAFIHLTSEATEEKWSFFEVLHFFENAVNEQTVCVADGERETRVCEYESVN